MEWQPPPGKFTGKFKLALLDENGNVIATKARGFDDYSWEELERTFVIKAKELARDFVHKAYNYAG